MINVLLDQERERERERTKEIGREELPGFSCAPRIAQQSFSSRNLLTCGENASPVRGHRLGRREREGEGRGGGRERERKSYPAK